MNEIEPATPGPWERSSKPHSKGETIGRPGKWRYVQHNFPEAPYEGELSDEWGIYPPLGEAGPVALVAGESNAKLIASAPDLLAERDGLLLQYNEVMEAAADLLYPKRQDTAEPYMRLKRLVDDHRAKAEKRKCPSTYTHTTYGKLLCEKDEGHLHRRGDVEHTRAGVKWMSE